MEHMKKIADLAFNLQENTTINIAYDINASNVLSSLIPLKKELKEFSNPYFLVWGIIILKYLDFFEGDARKNVESILVEEFQYRLGKKINSIDDIVKFYKNLEGKAVMEAIKSPKLQVMDL